MTSIDQEVTVDLRVYLRSKNKVQFCCFNKTVLFCESGFPQWVRTLENYLFLVEEINFESTENVDVISRH